MEITAAILRPETKAVVLDLDGTLYDKRGLGLRMVLGDLLESPLLWKDRKVRRQMRGQWFGSQAAFEEVFFANMVRHRLCTTHFVRWWYATIYMPLMVSCLRHYRPYAWVRPFLAACRQQHIAVVLLSDYACAEEKLQALGLETNLFEAVFASPVLGGLKPARQLLDTILEYVHATPEQCIVIGDREDTDGEMARRVGAVFHCIR